MQNRDSNETAFHHDKNIQRQLAFATAQGSNKQFANALRAATQALHPRADCVEIQK
jgi:hypothetical protein